MNPVIETLRDKKAELLGKLEALDAIEVTENRALVDVETAEYDALDAEFKAVSKRLASLEQRALDAAVGAALSARVDASRTTVYAGASESPYAIGSGHDFAQDLLRSEVNHDPEAKARILANNMQMRAEYRATNTAAIDGILVPKYESVVDPSPLEGRNFLNTLRSKPVTSEVVHIPTISSKPTAGFQSGQNSSFANADYGTDDATYTAVTLGGYTDISVQSLDWGSVTTAELINRIQLAYNRLVDEKAIIGTTTTNSLLGIVNTPGVISYNGSGIDTFAEFWSKLNEASADIEDNVFGAATHVVMSRRRWNWVKSLTAADGRPFLQTAYGQSVNVFGSNTYEINGLTVVVDNNVDANGATPTDNVIVYSPEDVHFYEANGGRLTTVYVDQVLAHQGTIRVVGRNYVNFPGVSPRPGAAAVIDGLPYPSF